MLVVICSLLLILRYQLLCVLSLGDTICLDKLSEAHTVRLLQVLEIKTLVSLLNIDCLLLGIML